MNTNSKEIIAAQIATYLADQPDLFLVNIKADAANNLIVYLDGDKGINIAQCTKVNRTLYQYIEENELFANNDFSLEVSSADIDEPLLHTRQYIKNIGRTVLVTQTDDTVTEGKLVSIADTNDVITLETTTGKGKKQVTETVAIPLNKVQSTIVQIKFN